MADVTMTDESKAASGKGPDVVTAEDLAARVAGLTITGTHAEAAKAAAAGRVLATHNGTFHCDEALAVGLLLLLPENQGVALIRSRDTAEIDKCNIVVDVGGTYDYSAGRFDHHQRSFTGTMTELGHDIKLSSAGLVYRHYGSQVISQLVGADVHDQTVQLVYAKIYKKFIREVDAIDNGVNVCDPDTARYTINTNLSARVSMLNPAWNDDVSDAGVNERFKKAVLMTTTEFIAHVRSLWDHWIPARKVVESSYDKREEVHASGLVMRLDRHCPWKGHLYDIEDERRAAGEGNAPLLYVLYGDTSGKWRIQCVSTSSSSFENRKSLPQPWCGLRGEELSTASGIPGGVFIHANGFIGGNATYEGALRMAVAAIEFEPTSTSS